MPKWIPCGAGFIEADVIRWRETAWKPSKPKKGRAVKLGERLVTAEVLSDEKGWVRLLVRGCEVLSESTGQKVAVLSKKTEIPRKRTTIERAKPERLLWSDESARALVASKFLGGR